MFEQDKLNILSILDAIAKILEYSKGYDNADAFYESQRDFDAVMMNFIVIGEMVSRVSDELIGQFKQIEWAKIRGFRNILAHNYFGIDAEEVWDIIQSHLPRLRDDLNMILEKIER